MRTSRRFTRQSGTTGAVSFRQFGQRKFCQGSSSGRPEPISALRDDGEVSVGASNLGNRNLIFRRPRRAKCSC